VRAARPRLRDGAGPAGLESLVGVAIAEEEGENGLQEGHARRAGGGVGVAVGPERVVGVVEEQVERGRAEDAERGHEEAAAAAAVVAVVAVAGGGGGGDDDGSEDEGDGGDEGHAEGGSDEVEGDWCYFSPGVAHGLLCRPAGEPF
jgi:hypothetical protein